jgi:ABC-type multidrug transport system ATPase subunit
MSTRILRALMQLFSLIASPDEDVEARKIIVKSFLEELLNKEQIDDYLDLYDKFVKQYRLRRSKSNPNKLLAVSSVKILTICSLLNEELTLQQKLIIVINLFEFIKNGNISSQAIEFIQTVADSFKISKEEYRAIKNFILEDKEVFEDTERILLINSQKNINQKVNHLYVPGLKGDIYFLYIKIQNLLIFYVDAENEVFLNQQLLRPYKLYVLSIGSALRTHTMRPIYYSDIISVFNEKSIKRKIVFEADKIFYKFKNGKIGIHEFNFVEKSGRLVGIMGASGSGKTTLLNLLNGNYKPTSGHIYINGIDLHKNKELFDGFIGYVSQDDLLIEELTVFENLYFNARLCFAKSSEFEIKRKVIKSLKELGLYEIKDQKVGSVLNQKISGGQRKRLNIALELIREPPILFLDEPTSGLSSRDSENIMDLLKDLTLKGKLVFVVIHQPSSAIFKMFDRLLVIDNGGYLIYNGKPIEAIIYFKSAIKVADWSDTVCPTCGNVNPEQIFNIIETRVLDEYGKQTLVRRFSPEDWYERFNKYVEEKRKHKNFLVSKLPKIEFNVPSRFEQFKVFVKRDILSKLSNISYILIIFLETPIIALILTYIIKYWAVDSKEGYTLYHNENLPVYIFMSVIVAIFVGLIVSAQEIYKDQKILKRESFLNLSRNSYLMSKLFNLFFISAYQSFAYVIIGNSLLKINFFDFYYWLALFSIWFASNILGLIISESFKSSSAIYIIIPFLVIPQIILSGVLVPYNKLNPTISKPYSIPWYGEIMIGRWGYEALCVKQFKDNPYNKKLFPYDQIISQADYIKDFWCSSMELKAKDYKKYMNIKGQEQRCADDLKLLKNEFLAGHPWFKRIRYKFDPYKLNIKDANVQLIDQVIDYIKKIKDYYKDVRNAVNSKKDSFIQNYDKNHPDENMSALKMKYHNEKLEDFVTNSGTERILEYKNRLYRMMKPIYYEPENKFFKAQYYAPDKPFFGLKIDTFWFDIIVIWMFSLIQYFFLYYKVLIKIFEVYDVLNRRSKLRREMRRVENIKNLKKNKKFKRFIQRYK